MNNEFYDINEVDNLKPKKNYKPVVLVILDGWGESLNNRGNAVAQACLPTIESLNNKYPKLLLQATGITVGLPWGVKGNSEVGHQTLGSGQIIFQYLPIINIAIASGEFANKPILKKAIVHLNTKKSKIHLWGLASDGGVHAHIDHLLSLMSIFAKAGIKDILVHVVTDGRDTSPMMAIKFVRQVKQTIERLGVGKIASVSGRFYSMDRNNSWDRIQKAYNIMVEGQGPVCHDVIKEIEKQHKEGKTDEYIEPTLVVDEENQPVGLIEDNDVVICFNYRRERAIELSKAIANRDFVDFKRNKKPDNMYICLVEYDPSINAENIFKDQEVPTRIGEIISRNGLKQLRIAETEKYAHVTFFFNCGEMKPYENEDRVLIPSKKVRSYDEIPEMSANEVTETILKAVDDGKYDFILVNYANTDMVGHTGNLKAGIKACEAVDSCLDRLISAVLSKDGCLLITADHGNVEEMINLNNNTPSTEHSSNPVPCWFVANNVKQGNLTQGQANSEISSMLADVAPTILDLLNIEIPATIKGTSMLGLFLGEQAEEKGKP